MDDLNNQLWRAVKRGKTSDALALLADGADVNLPNETGLTVLMEAARRGQIEMVNVLLTAGADINAQDKAGNTALMLAIDKKFISVVRVLLANGADSKAKDKLGKSALSRAQEQRGTNVLTAVVSIVQFFLLRKRTTGDRKLTAIQFVVFIANMAETIIMYQKHTGLIALLKDTESDT